MKVTLFFSQKKDQKKFLKAYKLYSNENKCYLEKLRLKWIKIRDTKVIANPKDFVNIAAYSQEQILFK